MKTFRNGAEWVGNGEKRVKNCMLLRCDCVFVRAIGGVGGRGDCYQSRFEMAW